MSLEKRGNSEIEVKNCNGIKMMILPGSNAQIPYDGRFNNNNLEKISSIEEGKSDFFPVD